MNLSSSSILALLLMGALLPAEAQERPAPSLADLNSAVESKNTSTPYSPVEIATNFLRLIKGDTFTPSPDLRQRIESYKKVLSSLRGDLLTSDGNPDSPQAKIILATFTAFFEKLDAAIEEGYKWQAVSPNVSPPHGTPNAAAGMNPYAIEDPELRKGYLDAIRAEQIKNLKNSQQSDLTHARTHALMMAVLIQKWASRKGVPAKDMIEALTPPGKSRQILTEKTPPQAIERKPEK